MDKNYFTQKTGFYGCTSPKELLKEYGSPLYVYNEKILRQRCREMANLVTYPNFRSNFSIKANSNIELLRIVREEGLYADAMSPGEIYILLKSGFKPEEIFYIPNNVSAEEMKYAILHGVLTSVDSLSQLRQYGMLNPGGEVAVRFNPGIGAGHHEKVVTGGKKTKFGINAEYIDDVKNIIKEHNLKLVGINQHIGSLFMEERPYIESTKFILNIAEQFEDLDFIDFGGGFGIPYHKQEGQRRLDIKSLGDELSEVMMQWSAKYGKKVLFKIEPGRYITAECGVLLGMVHAVKQNNGLCFAGTDIGLNALIRPAMYDSHHDIEVYKNLPKAVVEYKPITIVGNICESGDIIAKEMRLPVLEEGDIIGVMDAGAYGYSMSSNYNNRLRPAEVLVREDGSTVLIRRRDTFEDLIRNFEIK